MDFGSILHVAQKNEKLPKKEIKYYSTKFEPPKKEARSKQLSSNIKKFLARKELEEKQKSVEAREKRDELLALRSQDKKATRRVSVMLKRTKSANKSVIQDAVDNVNTAVTIAGSTQPDEDDYGYVSQEASAYYNKMMAKYNDMPEDSKFRGLKKNSNVNLNGTKDRVRAALLKEQEEALLPHKRKRKPKEDVTNEPNNEKHDIRYEPESKNSSKPAPKPKRAAPPPMNFTELLKIAEKKQFEPIVIEPKKEIKVDERPMTKRQRREFEKEKAWLERKDKGLPTLPSSKESIPSSSKSMPPPNKIPKLSSVPSKNGKTSKQTLADDSSSRNGIQKSSPSSANIPRKSDDRAIIRKSEERPLSVRKSDDRLSNGAPNPSSSTNRRPHSSFKASKLRTELEKKRSLPPKPHASSSQLNGQQSDRAQVNKLTNAVDKSKSLAVRKEGNDKSKPLLQNNGSKPPKQFPPADLKPKQFPPADLRSKQFPPEDARRRFPSKDVKRKSPMGHKRRILDDDDEDYDSEMDDFIDDGHGEAEDYSKYISEIFGYDKSRYRAEDYDDDNMESSFSQMMKEEFMSSKIGLLEDLEDMKKEAEDKKRKAIMKKGRK